MSETRCGLQISRDNTITNEVHNHPRQKQMGCLINGNILIPDDSMEADDVTDNTANTELLNQRDIKAAQRENAKAQTLGLNDLALANITGNISKYQENHLLRRLKRRHRRQTSSIEPIESGEAFSPPKRWASSAANSIVRRARSVNIASDESPLLPGSFSNR